MTVLEIPSSIRGSPLCDDSYTPEDNEEIMTNMISNLEERFASCDKIYKQASKSTELRYKEHIADLDSLIADLTKISSKYRTLVTNDSLESIISQEVDKFFGL